MGATEFVKRLLGKPVMIEDADYSYDDGFDCVPEADFRPVLAESNARVLSLAPEALAELDADLLTEDSEEVEDEAAWEAALAAARQDAFKSSQAPAPISARPAAARAHRPAQPAAQPQPATLSHGRSSRLPMQAPARRNSGGTRPTLTDPLARAAGLARAKAPAADTSLATRSMVSLSSISSATETGAVAPSRRRRDPTQQLVSRPTAVLTGPEVRRVTTEPVAAPTRTGSKAAPSAPARAPASGRRGALSTAPAGKLVRPAPVPARPAPAVEKEEDWEAMIARAKAAPAAAPAQPPFQSAPDEWALALDNARRSRVATPVEPDWESALQAAKARC